MLKNIRTSIIAGILFALFCCAGCINQPTDKERRLLDDAIEKKLSTALETFKSDGIKGVALYCERRDEIATQAGTFSIICTVAADFYGPNDKVMVDGSKMIMPVSVYTQTRNALHLLDQGWKFRDVSITAFAQGENHSSPSITKSKKIR